MHSVFLYHAIRAGMDMGIVNPSQLVIYNTIPIAIRKKIEDVILDRTNNSTEELINIANDAMKGVYNATVPNPVSNDEFMRTLRRAIRMPIGLPVAEWMVRFGANYFMRTDPELVLYGRYCVSRRLKQERFEFKFPDLFSAIKNLCSD